MIVAPITLRGAQRLNGEISKEIVELVETL
jgi:hypothetical protein